MRFFVNSSPGSNMYSLKLKVEFVDNFVNLFSNHCRQQKQVDLVTNDIVDTFPTILIICSY